ncbi:P2 family phage major capsid protein [Klebsiella pneumoniae]|uniref:P2 family phage major capsid protein n=1 Tax=Klebsiella pneumoniae TaxID=573 RepID=UPI0035321FED
MNFNEKIRCLINRNRQAAQNASPRMKQALEEENVKLEKEISLHKHHPGAPADGAKYFVNAEPAARDIFAGLPVQDVKTNDPATMMDRVIRELTGMKSQALNFSATPGRVSFSDVGASPVQHGELAASYGADFLSRINVIPVTESSATVVRMGSRGPLASTNNGGIRRNPVDSTSRKPHQYHCRKVNLDAQISYDELDAWSHLDNYPELARAAVERQRNLDRLMIGFTGTHYAPVSDPALCPNREDCGVGWLEKYRQEAPERVMDGLSVAGRDEDNRIIAYGDYGTIDALVLDGWQSGISKQYRNGLVAICSMSTLFRKEFPFVNAVSPNQPNMEHLVNELLLKNPTLGNLPAVPVPFFPDNAVWVTSLSNIALYWQKGSIRKRAVNEPHFNRLAVYESWNEAYMVERYEAGCLIDGIDWR